MTVDPAGVYPCCMSMSVGARVRFLIMDEKRSVLDEPEDGCPKGIIADADADHNLFGEFGTGCNTGA